MADIANSNLLQEIEGIRKLKDALIILVKTEWNAAIVDELENGCKHIFDLYDIKTKTLVVPGAVEISFAVKQAFEHSKKVKAFIALGCIVRGGTPHFDYVCKAVTDGVTALNLSLPVPTIFGVLTVDNEEQAKERIGGSHGHKGEEAALTALKMILLNNQLKKK
jgi:6,7-dimethyl-8-ribityllumazine synthase